MKAQVLTGLRQMKMVNQTMPRLEKSNDVLLRVAYVGVCGSDVHYYETGRIGSQVVQFPFAVGHECTAIVEAVGQTVQNVQVGQTVAVEPAVSCHQCDQCLAGRPHTCRKLKFLGCPGQLEGCLKEYIVMPSECCFPIDGKATLQQGVLCEPFAIGLYAVQLSDIRQGQRVAVLGSGPIGLSCLAAARASGAGRVYVTDLIDARLAAAKQMGADWVGNPSKGDIVSQILAAEPLGLDIVYECAGQQETLDQAIQLLKPGGKLMLIGIPRDDRVFFSPDLMRRKEIAILNVRRQNHCTQKAIDWVAQKKVILDPMITHTFDFEQTVEAFEMVAGYRDGVIKALIKIYDPK